MRQNQTFTPPLGNFLHLPLFGDNIMSKYMKQAWNRKSLGNFRSVITVFTSETFTNLGLLIRLQFRTDCQCHNCSVLLQNREVFGKAPTPGTQCCITSHVVIRPASCSFAPLKKNTLNVLHSCNMKSVLGRRYSDLHKTKRPRRDRGLCSWKLAASKLCVCHVLPVQSPRSRSPFLHDSTCKVLAAEKVSFALQ